MYKFLIDNPAFKRKPIEGEWAFRGQCIYHRPPRLLFKVPRLFLAGIVAWTGLNTYTCLTNHKRIEIEPEAVPEEERGLADKKHFRYELTPVGQRVAQAAGVTIMGIAVSAIATGFFSRTARRLHILRPRNVASSREPTLLMVENVLSQPVQGRTFDINRCSLVPGNKKNEAYLRIEGIKGSWFLYTDKVLTPNLPLGPNESERVTAELQKVIWDYRTDKKDLPVQLGAKSKATGMYHTFPFEPSIRVPGDAIIEELPVAEKESSSTFEPLPAQKDSSEGLQTYYDEKSAPPDIPLYLEGALTRRKKVPASSQSQTVTTAGKLQTPKPESTSLKTRAPPANKKSRFEKALQKKVNSSARQQQNGSVPAT